MFIIKFGEKYLFLDDLSVSESFKIALQSLWLFRHKQNIDQSFVEESAADDNGQDISNYDFSNDGFKSTVTTQMGGSSTRSSSVDLRQKMALRFRKIAEVYNTYADKLHGECIFVDSLVRQGFCDDEGDDKTWQMRVKMRKWRKIKVRQKHHHHHHHHHLWMTLKWRQSCSISLSQC